VEARRCVLGKDT